MKPILLMITLLTSTSASADGIWQHAVAPMGQYEGFYEDSLAGLQIYYGCTGISSTITFQVEGVNVAAGDSKILVGGQEVLSLNTEYHSRSDTTRITVRAEQERGAPIKNEINSLIDALGHGVGAVWITPNAKRFEIDLTNSAGILNCRL
jgi:hypothetical protein